MELADGTLLHNMRSYHRKNRRAVARSKDGGATWSAVTLDDALIEPVCQASMVRCTWPVRNERSRILFCNPASIKRENLTVRVSYDEGGSWTTGRQIHAGPSAYSCMAILPDKSVACVYECGEEKPYEEISFAHFSIEWLEGGKVRNSNDEPRNKSK